MFKKKSLKTVIEHINETNVLIKETIKTYESDNSVIFGKIESLKEERFRLSNAISKLEKDIEDNNSKIDKLEDIFAEIEQSIND